jgi:hypothetical protein
MKDESCLTINGLLDLRLDGNLKDLTLSPNFHHTAYLILDFWWGALVCCSSGFGDYGVVGAQELFLLSNLGRLGDFWYIG